MRANTIDDDLFLSVLRLLAGVRSGSTPGTGAPGRRIAEDLNISDVTSLITVLNRLQEQSLIEVAEREFRITDKGLKYLSEQFNAEPPDVV